MSIAIVNPKGVLIIFVAFGLVSAGGNIQPAPVLNILALGTYSDCDGKDAGNYTLTVVISTDGVCSLENADVSHISLTLIAPNGQRVVNNMEILAISDFPAGAYFQNEALYLSLSGNLEGKYLYRKDIFMMFSYLKKCSSLLGYSYTTSKSATLLISDTLDVNVLIAPTGGYEMFKRGCTTICKGQLYLV